MPQPLLSLLLLASAGSTPATGPTPAELPPAYARALDRAIERAHERFVESIDLWQDHSTWETAWKYESANYAVRTTASYYEARRIAQWLETLLGHMHEKLGSSYLPTRKFNVWLFPSAGEYNAFGQNSDEHSSWYGSFFDISNPETPVAAVYDPGWVDMYVWHGAVHQFLAYAYPGTRPLWLEEGLASYFSLYPDQNFDWGVEKLRNLVQSGDFVSLRRIFSARSLAEFEGPAGTLDRFAELGMFFMYLLHYREETRMDDPDAEAPFAQFVRALLENRDADANGSPYYRFYERYHEGLEEDFMAFEFPSR